jgi:DNA repair protein RadC
MNYTAIKKWPEDERPRERLLRYGADTLSTAQLLAIILRIGGRDKSAIQLAREVQHHFQSLQEIDGASLAEFSDIKGMGIAKVSQIKAAFELGKRLLQNNNRQKECTRSFTNSRDVYEYYRPGFFGLKKEKFLCAFLNIKNSVFKDMVVSEGTLTSSLVHPREVFRYAIKEAAASVLFIHNHPSGDTAPSKDDITITKRLVETGRIVGIGVLDHIIISDDRYLSLMEKGYLAE